MTEKKVAVMQPYIFPYLGYIQLVNAVDEFVFYDDVTFIKQGWINRNKLLIDGKEKLVTFPCVGISSNKMINEVNLDKNPKALRKILRSIKQSYSKALYFEPVFNVVNNILEKEYSNVAELAGNSVEGIANYLQLDVNFYYSSLFYPESADKGRADRLIALTKKLNSNRYINAIGGIKLYQKSYFEKHGIKLDFLNPSLPEYQQFEKPFVSGLSIIDVLMFNSQEQVREMLNAYELE